MSNPLPTPAIGPAPELVDRELEPLLSRPFADAWAAGEADGRGAGAVRGRLLERASASRVASQAMVTSRLRRLPVVDLAPGVRSRLLYTAFYTGLNARPVRPLRQGEPLQARLIELTAGATWSGPAPQHHREWLVLRGTVHIGDECLGVHDYHLTPAGTPASPVHASEDALVFVREATLPAEWMTHSLTVRNAPEGWAEFGPGVQRRVLWQREGQAAMLYLAEPGCSVPHHSHAHDEECLMLRGELFLDDELLQEGDYQLAPAGSCHRVVETDTGVMIFAHGDLDLLDLT